MSDYSKLTVAKLKDELDKRKLPKTGLKAALVQRLEEADAQAEPTQTAPTSGIEDQPEEAPDTYNDQVQDGSLAVQEDPQPGEPMGGVAVESDEQATDPLTNQVEAVIAAPTNQVAQEPRPNAEQSQRTAEPPSTGQATSQAPPSTATSDILPGNLTQNASRENTFDAHLPTPILTQNDERDTRASVVSTQASIGPEEMAEDSRKRKRRSQSPAPSSMETSKRLRAEDATDLRPEVNLPEDYSSSQNATTGPSQEGHSSQNLVNGNGEATPPETSSMEDVAPTQETAMPSKDVVVPPQEVDVERSGSGAESGEPVQQTSLLAEETSNKESPHKSPTPDKRFKSLAAPSSESKLQLTSESDLPTNDISPSTHPATSALYIRNLMRPLNPASFKSHLISLARPPSSSPNASSASDIITTLHIDSIRTHALILFSDIAAASRVRASLHDRPWPVERDRKPLWIDFVPEDKVSKWIEVETSQTGSGARGGSNTRWEVVYETEDDGVETYLQEVGAAGAAATSRPSRDSQSGPSAAAAAAPPAPLIKQAAESKEFKALDDLFSSTAAKPKLYYLPVERSIVEKRLALLDEGKGGGRGDEMLRYSFEDGIIVEKGPEFGRGFRGARGGRRGGGYGDVYSGRGSGGGRGRVGDGGGFRGGGGYRNGEADRSRGWGTY
ncbi:MAG: hypothetical protein OHK93_003420 [Ramalina farinacea]|uniref:SAP domain-containing protein n=1 Tax=Ramalina farinacea TaxID=258253 RepID=A0AA43QT81_9LECA|nr:hypothetical protein [Ramalina farinacea]